MTFVMACGPWALFEDSKYHVGSPPAKRDVMHVVAPPGPFGHVFTCTPFAVIFMEDTKPPQKAMEQMLGAGIVRFSSVATEWYTTTVKSSMTADTPSGPVTGDDTVLLDEGKDGPVHAEMEDDDDEDDDDDDDDGLVDEQDSSDEDEDGNVDEDAGLVTTTRRTVNDADADDDHVRGHVAVAPTRRRKKGGRKKRGGGTRATKRRRRSSFDEVLAREQVDSEEDDDDGGIDVVGQEEDEPEIDTTGTAIQQFLSSVMQNASSNS